MTTLTQQMILRNVDWTIAGAGDARDGDASVTVSGVNGEAEVALLYWGELNFSGSSDNMITLNGTAVQGERLGTSVDTCWGSDHSIGYYADVTALVNGNGTYNIEGMGRGGQGASLVVFYDDGDATNNRDVSIYAGNDSTDGDRKIVDMNLGQIDYQGGDATITLNVGDGQSFSDGALTLNGTTLGTNQFPGGNGALWDVNTYDISAQLSTGTNALNLRHVSDSDCLQFVSAIVDKPSETKVLFLDFDTAIPRDFYVTNTSFWDFTGFTAEQDSAFRLGTEPLGVFTNTQKSTLVQLVQDIFDRSDIEMHVTSTQPTESEYTSIRFSSDEIEYNHDGSILTSDVRLLGQAYEGIDRYDINKNSIVAVLMDGSDNLLRVAETIVHEGAHAWGGRHINPLEGNGIEVLDYDGQGLETFYDEPAFITEPPRDGEAASTVSHNPAFHIRRFATDETFTQLKLEGLEPGAYEQGSFSNNTYTLSLSGLSTALTGLWLMMPNRGASVEGDAGENTNTLIEIARDVTQSDIISFDVPDGEDFIVVGSTGDDTDLDVVFEVDPAKADPLSVTSNRYDDLSGRFMQVTGENQSTDLGDAALAVTAVVVVQNPDEDPELVVSIDRTSMSEAGGAAIATISRGDATSGDLTVTLSSNDTSEINVAASVVILDGQSEVQVDLIALDDSLVDGPQTTTITAQAEGFSAGQSSIEVIDDDGAFVGTEDADTLVGTNEGEELIGRGGDDVIDAQRGADFIDAGDGNDNVWGDGGDDVIYGGAGNDSLRGGRENDFIDGGAGDDFIVGQRNGDTIVGGDGDDIIKGGGGNDEMAGDAGNDFLKGGTFRDTMTGGEGDDTISGNRAEDFLDGGAGNDSLNGGGEDDVLTGGLGDDWLKGGGGNDLFIFNNGDGDDIIQSFVIADDMLLLDEAAAAGQTVAELVSGATVTSTGVLLTLADDDSIFFNGMSSTTGLELAIDIIG